MRSEAEEQYEELVGEDGYLKALRSFNILTNYSRSEVTSTLFFTTLINAFWRGKNKGLEDRRDVLKARLERLDTTK